MAAVNGVIHEDDQFVEEVDEGQPLRSPSPLEDTVNHQDELTSQVDSADPEPEENFSDVQKSPSIPEDFSNHQLSPAQLSPAPLSPAPLSPAQLSPAPLSPAELSPTHQFSPTDEPPNMLVNPAQGRRVPCGPIQPIADIRGVDTLNYRKGEKVLRCKVATCCRLVDIFGWSIGVHSFVSARIDKNIDQLLVPPHGMMCDEVTAASLVKADFNGQVVDPGCTDLGIFHDDVLLHSAVYSARNDLNCAIHIASPGAVSVSILKCGLLPLCQEAMVIGKISYHEYSGLISDQADRDKLGKAFDPSSKVLFLRNFGVIIAGETIEEAFYMTNCVMTAIETQLNLIPFGLDNFHLPSEDILRSVTKSERELPPGVNAKKEWRCGEVEFEALVRQLDNAGYCTGYVSQGQGLKRTVRSHSTTEITPTSFSVFGDERKLGSALDRSVTPGIYQRNESAGPASNKQRGARWVVETGGLNKPRSASVKALHVNQFAPMGVNPKELKEKVKMIRKEYFEDTITSGPQSSVLEGVTWEEARKIKQGHMVGGIDNVLVTAASRGIIQRDHQREALFYKNYTMGNPFENVTDYELEKYKEEVEQKTKQSSRPQSTQPPAHAVEVPPRSSSAVPPRYESPPIRNEPVFVAPVKTPPVVTEAQQISKPVLTPQMKQQPASPGAGSGDAEPEKEKIGRIDDVKTFPQRTQSARYPDRRQELVKESQPSVQKSESVKRSDRKAAGHDGLLESPVSDGKDHHSSKENSPTRDIAKEKKKKQGFKLPSFSKKKEKP